MPKETLIANIGRLVTMEKKKGRDGALGAIEDAAILIHGNKIEWFGRTPEIPKPSGREDVIDADGAVVMPGLVDCHTHIVHSGFRQDEFNMRSNGKSYAQIAKQGGGIMSTVKKTRDAPLHDLVAGAMSRVDEALSRGTTTIEVKTGYGLDAKSEAKMIGAIHELAGSARARIVGTFLGAHIVPPEFKKNRSKYVRLLIDEMIPGAAKAGIITACDIFVEKGAFTVAEAKKIAAAAKAHGLAIHLHADQWSDGGGAKLAAELGALSADHLDCTSKSGARAMARAGVTGVLLPGASFFAGKGRYPNARVMIDQGLCVAIATDYNPGTNPSLDLWMAATIAVSQMGLSCDEALLGVTKNAALALGLNDCGTIAAGKRADIIIIDAPDEYFPLYRYGVNFVRERIAGGRVVHYTEGE